MRKRSPSCHWQLGFIYIFGRYCVNSPLYPANILFVYGGSVIDCSKTIAAGFFQEAYEVGRNQ